MPSLGLPGIKFRARHCLSSLYTFPYSRSHVSHLSCNRLTTLHLDRVRVPGVFFGMWMENLPKRRARGGGYEKWQDKELEENYKSNHQNSSFIAYFPCNALFGSQELTSVAIGILSIQQLRLRPLVWKPCYLQQRHRCQ